MLALSITYVGNSVLDGQRVNASVHQTGETTSAGDDFGDGEH